jgi:DNA-directed RNA polymerase specialized sigma24 family protein
MIAFAPLLERPTELSWQGGFLALLPWIERQARAAFRDFDAEAKADAVAEVVANVMCAYQRLHERGELARAFPSTLTRFAIAQFHSGRRVGASQNSSDVYFLKRRKRSECSLPRVNELSDAEHPWQEALVDNRRSSVPAQVAFRLDFPCWLDRLPLRNRLAAERLLMGFTTGEVAQELQVSAGRISQLRRELADSWYTFVANSRDNTQVSNQEADKS